MSPMFEEPLRWSGEVHEVEDWPEGRSDGLIALMLGCGIVGAAALAALGIAIGMSLGRLV